VRGCAVVVGICGEMRCWSRRGAAVRIGAGVAVGAASAAATGGRSGASGFCRCVAANAVMPPKVKRVAAEAMILSARAERTRGCGRLVGATFSVPGGRRRVSLGGGSLCFSR